MRWALALVLIVAATVIFGTLYGPQPSGNAQALTSLERRLHYFELNPLNLFTGRAAVIRDSDPIADARADFERHLHGFVGLHSWGVHIVPAVDCSDRERVHELVHYQLSHGDALRRSMADTVDAFGDYAMAYNEAALELAPIEGCHAARGEVTRF